MIPIDRLSQLYKEKFWISFVYEFFVFICFALYLYTPIMVIYCSVDIIILPASKVWIRIIIVPIGTKGIKREPFKIKSLD